MGITITRICEEILNNKSEDETAHTIKQNIYYIKHIRKLLDIDLRYIMYDFDNEIIFEEI